MVFSDEIRKALSVQNQEYHNTLINDLDRKTIKKARQNGENIPPAEALNELAVFWAQKWIDLDLPVPVYITRHIIKNVKP
jgi:hypothetical protein